MLSTNGAFEREMTRPPQPVQTKETQSFWDGARTGCVVLWRCEDCGRLAAPPSPRCPSCLSNALSPFPYSGRILLKGRTVLTVPAFDGQNVPAPVAECAVEDEPRIVLIAQDPENFTRDLAPGAPLALAFDTSGDSFPIAIVQSGAA